MVLKVLVADSIDEELVERLKEHAHVEVVPNLSREDLIKRVRDADALVVRGRTCVTKDVIREAERLKVIARAGAGVDNIDVEFAADRGVYVVTAAEAPADSVAELTIGLMIALARRIPVLNESVRRGLWPKDRALGAKLRGKTLGIVGLGRIGSRVARVAKAMGMCLLAYDPYVSKDRARELGADLVDLETLLRSSEFVSLHVPLTRETWKLIGERELELMKPGAFLINTARGGIVDEGALYRALTSGKLAGAALDVLEAEPPKSDKALLKLDSVVVTPHVGASTKEAQQRVAATLAEDIVRVLRGEEPLNCVRPSPSSKTDKLR